MPPQQNPGPNPEQQPVQPAMPAPQPAQPQYQQPPQPQQQLPQPIIPIQPGGQNQAGQQTGMPGQPGRFQPHPRPAVALQPQDTPTVTDAPEAGSPYDFFLEPAPAQVKKKLVHSGMSSFTKIMIGAGIFLVLIGLLAVGLSASRSKTPGPGTGILGIAQSQQEIVRISTDGVKNLDSQSLKGFAVTAQSTIATSQKDLIEYAGKSGAGIDEKQLDLTKSTNTDKALEAALSASTYDATFTTVMQKLLADYQKKTEAAIAGATTDSGRDLLNKTLTNAKLLVQMLTSASNGVADPTATPTAPAVP